MEQNKGCGGTLKMYLRFTIKFLSFRLWKTRTEWHTKCKDKFGRSLRIFETTFRIYKVWSLQLFHIWVCSCEILKWISYLNNILLYRIQNDRDVSITMFQLSFTHHQDYWLQIKNNTWMWGNTKFISSVAYRETRERWERFKQDIKKWYRLTVREPRQIGHTVGTTI